MTNKRFPYKKSRTGKLVPTLDVNILHVPLKKLFFLHVRHLAFLKPLRLTPLSLHHLHLLSLHTLLIHSPKPPHIFVPHTLHLLSPLTLQRLSPRTLLIHSPHTPYLFILHTLHLLSPPTLQRLSPHTLLLLSPHTPHLFNSHTLCNLTPHTLCNLSLCILHRISPHTLLLITCHTPTGQHHLTHTGHPPLIPTVQRSLTLHCHHTSAICTPCKHTTHRPFARSTSAHVHQEFVVITMMSLKTRPWRKLRVTGWTLMIYLKSMMMDHRSSLKWT